MEVISDDDLNNMKIDMLSAAPAAFRAHLASQNPQGRLGTIGDLGDAVALIVSESARWISGQAISVSGKPLTDHCFGWVSIRVRHSFISFHCLGGHRWSKIICNSQPTLPLNTYNCFI
jgi:hypothetical protein